MVLDMPPALLSGQTTRRCSRSTHAHSSRTIFGMAGGELELQADRQRNDLGHQPLGLQLVEMAKQLAHFLTADEVCGLAGREHGNMATGIRAIGPMPPDLGQVEHLPHDAKGAVCIGLLVPSASNTGGKLFKFLLARSVPKSRFLETTLSLRKFELHFNSFSQR